MSDYELNGDGNENPFTKLDSLLQEQGFEVGGTDTNYNFDYSDEVDALTSNDLPEELSMTFIASADVISEVGKELESVQADTTKVNEFLAQTNKSQVTLADVGNLDFLILEDNNQGAEHSGPTSSTNIDPSQIETQLT